MSDERAAEHRQSIQENTMRMITRCDLGPF
jgi:hypothetical protein